jgi:putative ABC transport system permease protein
VVDGPWHQIVAVVRDFPHFPARLAIDTPAAVYHPATLGDMTRIFVALRFANEPPRDLAERARQIAAEIDPALQVERVLPLFDFYWQFLRVWGYLAWALGLVTVSALLLSAAGLYAMMAFIIAQRQREIGVRIALGATPRRLLLTIFDRAVRQLALGIAFGAILSWSVLSLAGFEPSLAAGLICAVAAITALVGVLAAVGPARRILRVPAAEALRAERA